MLASPYLASSAFRPIHAPVGTQALHQQEPAAALGFEVWQSVVTGDGCLNLLLIGVPDGNEHPVVVAG
jgi:hypothetical protein